MIKYIEDLLQKKTENKRSKILYTQWLLTKEHIPEILNVITQIFPHYSLHDQSHSESIINNIVRVIGEDTLNKFSSLDLWLLLSSAFYHDIGMVVLNHDLKNLFNNNDFLDMVVNLQNEKSSPLFDIANSLLIKNKKIYYKNNEVSYENYNSFRYLIAEYFRKNHSERSSISLDNNKFLNFSGDHIPSRIINVLSEICNSHTQSFTDVLKLSKSEAGLDTEDCHPLYIACLLRIGDLLDIDNNRFSEILLQTLSNIPIDSIHHKQKHFSIKHITINKCLIELKAICDDYESAYLTSNWFNMLDNEISNQMKKWTYIVPDTSYGFLPTLGELKVELKDYDPIDGKLKPSFQIDNKKAIELLQGAGFYNDKHKFIRELLQNAVDATFLRIKVNNQINNIELTRDDFYKECKKYPIIIIVTKKETGTSRNIWNITIHDNGIGFSESDIKSLINTGSNYQNTEKNRIIDSMPEWMKPSGVFGIGFQSIFLFCDYVTIETKRINKEYAKILELFNPVGKKQGMIRQKTIYHTNGKTGTTIKFDISIEKIPTQYSINLDQNNTYEYIQDFDFIYSNSLDIDIYKIIDEICKFSTSSEIPISLQFNDKIEILNSNRNKEKLYFDEVTGLEVVSKPNNYINRLYYRYNLVEKASINILFLSFYINILSGSAKDILTLNRDSVKKSYQETLDNRITKTIVNYVSKQYKDFNPDLKKSASMFIHYYNQNNKYSINNEDFSDWKNYKIDCDGKKIELKDFFENNSKLYFIDISMKANYKSFIETDNEDTLIFIESHNEIFRFIKLKASLHYSSFSYSSKIIKDYSSDCIIVQKSKKCELICNWEGWLRNIYLNNMFYSRGLMPCNNQFLSLELRKDFYHSYIYDHTFSGFSYQYPKMICPYVRKRHKSNKTSLELDISDSLYQIVYENRMKSSVTLEDIKLAYQEFVTVINPYVELINSENSM